MDKDLEGKWTCLWRTAWGKNESNNSSHFKQWVLLSCFILSLHVGRFALQSKCFTRGTKKCILEYGTLFITCLWVASGIFIKKCSIKTTLSKKITIIQRNETILLHASSGHHPTILTQGLGKKLSL